MYSFNAVCASVQYALLIVLALACGLPLRHGILAATLGALLPLCPLLEIRAGGCTWRSRRAARAVTPGSRFSCDLPRYRQELVIVNVTFLMLARANCANLACANVAKLQFTVLSC